MGIDLKFDEKEDPDFIAFRERQEEMKKEVKSNLVKLHERYKELLYIEDTKRIDVVLAVALSQKMEGIPLWLILVGASGDMKSDQLSALKNFNSFILHNITSKTLVNGYPDKEKHPDLAPLLHKKIILIFDMAQILKLAPVEKAELWGQLRGLYDGCAGKVSGMGSQARYEGLKVTLIAGSTPAIDGQILIHQDLGTRELIYRTKGNKNKEKVMEKCFENEEFEEKIKKELTEITTDFLQKTEIRREYIPKNVLDEIKKMAIYLSFMRAPAEYDSFTNEIRNDIYPEEPTRIAKQLKRLFICLMSLSDDYPQDRALEVLWEICKSSGFPLRMKIFDYLTSCNTELTTSYIADEIHIGKSTAKRELGALWNMGFMDLHRVETNYPDKFIDYWKLKENHLLNKKSKENEEL